MEEKNKQIISYIEYKVQELQNNSMFVPQETRIAQTALSAICAKRMMMAKRQGKIDNDN